MFVLERSTRCLIPSSHLIFHHPFFLFFLSTHRTVPVYHTFCFHLNLKRSPTFTCGTVCRASLVKAGSRVSEGDCTDATGLIYILPISINSVINRSTYKSVFVIYFFFWPIVIVCLIKLSLYLLHFQYFCK